ncbi:MAG: SMP-30/gluconolactonase/LRE family protein [Acidobacteria bacterium]|nr:SMP-30/gluconolactonase/LRE family protein [Acidobacteriota bacterium]
MRRVSFPTAAFAALLALAGLLVGCGGASEPPASAPIPATEPPPAPAAAAMLPDEIVAERGGFIPEGVEFDMMNGRLLTGSLSEGSVYEVHPDGRVTPLVEDEELVSSVGIEADEPRDRLLVANADRSVFQSGGVGQAKLGVYNLTTGERIAMVDLAAVAEAGDDAVHFANDVAVSDDGTAYVTDTRLNALYRVTADYEASLFHRFDDGGAGPNGIVHHPGGYLLVARGATLWKVPLADPAASSEVTLPQEVPGQDGMVWSAGRLAIVSNSANQVVALTSDDDWATASVAAVASYETQATTAAVVGDDVYVVHPHFADEDPPSITRVTFE